MPSNQFHQFCLLEQKFAEESFLLYLLILLMMGSVGCHTKQEAPKDDAFDATKDNMKMGLKQSHIYRDGHKFMYQKKFEEGVFHAPDCECRMNMEDLLKPNFGKGI